MYVFVGLGNPGARYDGTRHNIGFEAIDYFARKHQFKLDKLKHKSLYTKQKVFDEDVLFVKPQTYMNLSGEALYSIIKYYDIELTNLYVIYDDIDLKLGQVRIRKSGSGGTHNGMRNIIYMLKSQEFTRLRIGIGRNENIPLDKYVISRFDKSEIDVMEDAIIKVSDCMESILKNGIDYAMNNYNSNVKRMD